MPSRSRSERFRGRRPLAVDLFCGAGGLSVGLKKAGFVVVAAVDLDATACATYRLNHPDTSVIQGDIARLTAERIRAAARIGGAAIDLVAACPPCQGFSRVRTRNGRRPCDDPRNGLVLEALRLIRELAPSTVMLENVPGLARDERYQHLRRELAALGYAIRAAVLDAAHYGVPQRRKRLVLLASRFALPSFGAPAAAPATVRQAIGRMPPTTHSRDALHGYARNHGRRVSRLIRSIPRDGGSRTALGTNAQLGCHTRCDGFSDVYGRMAWDAPAPTITSGCINPSKGRFIHPEANRAITLREAAALQTFPRSYKFPLNHGLYAAASLIGNALPPEFARRHSIALLATLGARSPKPTKPKGAAGGQH